MNYDQKMKAWAERRRKVIAALKEGKDRSEVAKAFRITRQRLHQIIQAETQK